MTVPVGRQGSLWAADLQGAEQNLRLMEWNPGQWPVATGWARLMADFLAAPEGLQLAAFIRGRLQAGATIYPPAPFKAMEILQPQDVRVVILGQDPYHGPGQAQGLAFSVPSKVRIPPSLRNIFKELARDVGCPEPASGSLTPWVQQGVLLLNTCLTVEEGAPASHARQGWEFLTDRVIQHVLRESRACVFMLWGAHAQAKETAIRTQADMQGRDVLVLMANHPSPLSARRPPVPFLGCGHFSQASHWHAGRTGVLDWRL
jgi:uracil-DNA glycosylase